MLISSKTSNLSRETKFAGDSSTFNSNKRIRNHKCNCYGNEAATIVLPEDKKTLHQFKTTKTTRFALLVVQLENETLLVPIHICESAPNASARMKLQKNISSCYAFIFVEHRNDNFLSYTFRREHVCLEVLIKDFKKIAKDIFNKFIDFSGITLQYEKKTSLTTGLALNFSKMTRKRFWAPRQYSDKSLSWPHSKCNLKTKSIKFTPVIAYIMAGYVFLKYVQ